MNVTTVVNVHYHIPMLSDLTCTLKISEEPRFKIRDVTLQLLPALIKYATYVVRN